MRPWILAVVLLLALSGAYRELARTIDLHPLSRGGWKSLRTMHEGQATVVHFWGMDCGPCLAELPAWAAFIDARPDLKLVLVEADPIPGDHDSVVRMLTKNRLTTAENWILTDPVDDKLRYEIDAHWEGETPYTLLIARDGATRSVSGEVDFAMLSAWLDTQK